MQKEWKNTDPTSSSWKNELFRKLAAGVAHNWITLGGLSSIRSLFGRISTGRKSSRWLKRIWKMRNGVKTRSRNYWNYAPDAPFDAAQDINQSISRPYFCLKPYDIQDIKLLKISVPRCRCIRRHSAVKHMFLNILSMPPGNERKGKLIIKTYLLPIMTDRHSHNRYWLRHFARESAAYFEPSLLQEEGRNRFGLSLVYEIVQNHGAQ